MKISDYVKNVDVIYEKIMKHFQYSIMISEWNDGDPIILDISRYGETALFMRPKYQVVGKRVLTFSGIKDAEWAAVRDSLIKVGMTYPRRVPFLTPTGKQLTILPQHILVENLLISISMPQMERLEPPPNRVKRDIILSDQERIVIQYLLQDYTITMVADAMHLSESTVKTYCKRIRKKLFNNARGRLKYLLQCS